jgi:hypothetical protein
MPGDILESIFAAKKNGVPRAPRILTKGGEIMAKTL